MERVDVVEQLVRQKGRLREEDRIEITLIPGFGELDFVYRLNASGGPLVGGESYIVNASRRAVYKVPSSLPTHISAKKVREGRMSPL